MKVWNCTLELSCKISDLVKTFPKDELFVLIPQIKRAADSVVLNIAEGSTLQSKAEFKRFLIIANRSALELVSCLYIARGRKLIQEKSFLELYSDYERLVKSIQALIRSIDH